MNTKRCPKVPITISEFSRDRIVLRSTGDMDFKIVFPAVLGAFLVVPGAVQGLTHQPLLPVPTFLLLGVGIVLMLLSILLRSPTWELIIRSSDQKIINSRNYKTLISFSDITSIYLKQELQTNRWRIELETLKNKRFTLVYGYPLDVALYFGMHLSYMFARPFKVPQDVPLPDQIQQKWQLPWNMPSSFFPVEWTILAGALGSLILLFSAFHNLNLFNPFVFPRWLLVPSFALPAALLCKTVLVKRGMRAMYSAQNFSILLLILITVLELSAPKLVLWSLIPVFLFGTLAITSALEGRKAVTSIAIAIAAILFTGPLCVQSIIGYYTIKHFDPGVVDAINLYNIKNNQPESEATWKLNRPGEIRNFTMTLNKIKVQKQEKRPVSHAIQMEVIRPFGENMHLLIHREGVRKGAVAVIRMMTNYLGFRVCLVSLSGKDLDDALIRLGLKTHFWPPEY